MENKENELIQEIKPLIKEYVKMIEEKIPVTVEEKFTLRMNIYSKIMAYLSKIKGDKMSEIEKLEFELLVTENDELKEELSKKIDLKRKEIKDIEIKYGDIDIRDTYFIEKLISKFDVYKELTNPLKIIAMEDDFMKSVADEKDKEDIVTSEYLESIVREGLEEMDKFDKRLEEDRQGDMFEESEIIPQNIQVIYDAEENAYSIRDTDTNIYVYRSLRKENLELTDKDKMVEQLGVKKHQLNYLDMSVVAILEEFDDFYGTNKANDYISSVLNPKTASRNLNIFYDLRELEKNKSIEEEQKREVLGYADFAETFGIGVAKKSISTIIKEKIREMRETSKIRKELEKENPQEEFIELLAERPKNSFLSRIKLPDKYMKLCSKIEKANNSSIEIIEEDACTAFRYNDISEEEYMTIIELIRNKKMVLNITDTIENDIEYEDYDDYLVC